MSCPWCDDNDLGFCYEEHERCEPLYRPCQHLPPTTCVALGDWQGHHVKPEKPRVYKGVYTGFKKACAKAGTPIGPQGLAVSSGPLLGQALGVPAAPPPASPSEPAP